MLNYIVWDVNPAIFELGGREIRYYGLFFALAFIISQFIMNNIYQSEGRSQKDADGLTIYLVFGTIIGARLGHCFFYDFEYYVLENPIEIFKVWEGGLASHGGAIGILTGLWMYKNKFKYDYIWVLDRIVIVVAIAAFCVRMGNLMNSEIVGVETDVSWAFQFVRNDCPPPYSCDIASVPARHPAQLYEALSYLMLFFALVYLYKKTNIKEIRGRLLGVFLVSMFTFRFLFEFIKENQSSFEDGLVLNMGQNLSIPFIAAGIYFLVRKKS